MTVGNSLGRVGNPSFPPSQHLRSFLVPFNTLNQVHHHLYAKGHSVDVVFVLAIVIVAFAHVGNLPFLPLFHAVTDSLTQSSISSVDTTMSSIVKVYINDESKPANIPDYTTIIKRGFDERPRQATATNISGVRLDLDKRSDLDVGNVWVKFGRNITMGEANTQHFVAQYLQANNVSAVRAPRVYLAFTWNVFGHRIHRWADMRQLGCWPRRRCCAGPD